MLQESLSRRQFMNTPVVSSLALGALAATPASAFGPVDDRALNVLKHGAKGDGKTRDTQALQAAIDACYQAGGGTIVLPAGTFLSGSLHLKSGVALHLDHGATLRASPDQADF